MGGGRLNRGGDKIGFNDNPVAQGKFVIQGFQGGPDIFIPALLPRLIRS